MSRQDEAKELITQWVFEGKDLETIQKDILHTPLSSALSPQDVELEYYAARAGRKMTNSRPPGKRLAQIIGVLAILIGLVVLLFLPLILGVELARAVGRYRILGGFAVFIGVILLTNPARAFEKD